jgi:hypothetical protein
MVHYTAFVKSIQDRIIIKLVYSYIIFEVLVMMSIKTVVFWDNAFNHLPD